MSTPEHGQPPKGWREMTAEERKALPPAERARARLRDLDERRKAQSQKVARLERRETAAERRRDTRRKILIGAAVDAWSAEKPKRQEWLRQVLDAGLTRDEDRALLGLPRHVDGHHPVDDPPASAA